MPDTENIPKDAPYPQENTEQPLIANPQRVFATLPSGSESQNKPNPNMVMALVLCFMLILGLAVAFFFNQKKPVVDADTTADKERIQRLIYAEKNGVSPDEQTSSAALEGQIDAILNNAQALQLRFESLKTANQKLTGMNTQLENQVQGNVGTITRIGTENAGLKNQVAQLQNLARNAQAYQQQAQNYGKAIAEKDAIIAQLQNRPSSDSLQQLRKTLGTERTTKEELFKKVQSLELKMSSMVDAKDAGDQALLRKQNDELRRQIQELQTKIDFSKLFVKSYDQLPPKAQKLYNELKGLEGFDAQKLSGAYTKIANELSAETLQQVKFATGSSILNFADQTKIKGMLDTTNDTDYFLVVGYASKTGGAVSNEKLSAKRATAVASVVNQLKRQGQDVRAVYLGQTDRFSATNNADNQLCEIWKIKK